MRTFFPLVLLALFFLSACSKKDIRQDEPVITTDESSSARIALETPPAVEKDESAGAVGTPVPEMQTVFFGFDSFTLSERARETLKQNANWLKANESTRIQIEGHCDERGTTEYNLALGEKRANAARAFLVRLGVKSSRVSVISYGKERPDAMGHSESAWAKNRRATFIPLQ